MTSVHHIHAWGREGGTECGLRSCSCQTEPTRITCPRCREVVLAAVVADGMPRSEALDALGWGEEAGR